MNSIPDINESLEAADNASASTLVIACGALARELLAVIRLNG